MMTVRRYLTGIRSDFIVAVLMSFLLPTLQAICKQGGKNYKVSDHHDHNGRRSPQQAEDRAREKHQNCAERINGE